MSERERTLMRILQRTAVKVERMDIKGEPARYVFDLHDIQVGNPARGIAEAELMAYAIRDYARITGTGK